jgi:hypothetical protein
MLLPNPTIHTRLKICSHSVTHPSVALPVLSLVEGSKVERAYRDAALAKTDRPPLRRFPHS